LSFEETCLLKVLNAQKHFVTNFWYLFRYSRLLHPAALDGAGVTLREQDVERILQDKAQATFNYFNNKIF
jgi:hypothetical protein